MPIATPALTVNIADDHISVTFANSDTPTFNFLKRNSVYISKTIASDGAFLDYQTRSGEQVFYVGSAFDGTQESAPTSPQTGTVTLDLATIHKVRKSATSNISGAGIELFNQEGQQQTRTRESEILQLAAQEQPRIKTSELVGRYVECPIYILRADWGAMIPALEAMIWSDDLFCFRDQFGELMFCTFPDQEAKFTQFKYNITLRLIESAYSEAVT